MFHTVYEYRYNIPILIDIILIQQQKVEGKVLLCIAALTLDEFSVLPPIYFSS